MTDTTTRPARHNCGGTIQSRESGAQQCDKCQAFTLDASGAVPDGTDMMRNLEAWHAGADASPARPRWMDAAEVARHMRKALKAAHPATKFSVRTSKYAGGASIRVTWTDGPTEHEVAELTEHYAGATFDGMRDLRESRGARMIGGELVYSGAHYVFTDRSYSREFLEPIARQVAEDFGRDVPEIVEGHGGARAVTEGHEMFMGSCSFGDYVMREARRVSGAGS